MFEQVKQEIDNKIKTNGNNEITANRLNGVLQDMMDASAEVIEEVQQSIGDHVEANPTGEATEMLGKLKIGETIYKTGNPFAGEVDATDEERLKALANVSNQTANSTTGKMGYKVLDGSKSFASQVTDTNTIYEIRDVFDLGDINGESPITIPAGCTLKFVGGKIKDGTLEGTSTSVFSESKDKCIFDNVTFSGKWCNSSLTALNFGFVDDMTYEDYLWEYKGLSIQTKKAQGTDNVDVIDKLASFLTNAEYIDIEFNGSFYCATDKYLYFYTANNINLFGGNITFGIIFYGCNNCNVRDIYFSGYHKPHAFPKLCYNEQYISNDVFNVNEGFDNLGIVNTGCVTAGASYNHPEYFCENIICSNCVFEMHVNGFTVQKPASAYNRYCYCRDCSFDSIFYQPIGFHGENCGAENIIGRYCGQAVDFSSWSHDCYARNIYAYEGFGIGPKMTSSAEGLEYTYNCILENCYFEMNDYLTVDLSINVVQANGKLCDNSLQIINCKFNCEPGENFNAINSGAVVYNGALLNTGCYIRDTVFNLVGKVDRALSVIYSAVLDNTTVNIERNDDGMAFFALVYQDAVLKAKNSLFKNKYESVNRGFTTNGGLNGSKFIFENCVFDTFYQFLINGQDFNFTNCTIKGNGMMGFGFFSQTNAQATSQTIKLSFEGCKIDLVGNLLINSTDTSIVDIVFNNNTINSDKPFFSKTLGNTQDKKFVFTNNVYLAKETYLFQVPETNLAIGSVISNNVFGVYSGTSNKYVVDYNNSDMLNSFTEIADNNVCLDYVKGTQSGTSAFRATSLSAKKKGYCFFNETTGIPNYWNGTGWVDAAGNVV